MEAEGMSSTRIDKWNLAEAHSASAHLRLYTQNRRVYRMSAVKSGALEIEFHGLLRYPEAAAYIGLAEGTLRNQHEALGIRSVKIGRIRCFRIEDLDDFIARKILETERKQLPKKRRGRGESLVFSPDFSFWLVIAALLLVALIRLSEMTA
ncbi:hypothetical protein K6W37_15590 [Acetobacter senegalensis]|nr:hypothetical protein [Acetobacter senegalensis]